MAQSAGDLDAALWRGVFDSSPDAVVVVDPDGVIVAANARCLGVFGHAPDVLVGRPIEVLVPSRVRETHPQRRASYDAVERSRPMGLLQLSAERADGTEFPAEISLVRIPGRNTTWVCATVRDVSAQVAERDRFRSLLESAPDAMVIVDADARIVLSNRQVGNLFGYEPDELLGQPVEVLVPDRFREGHMSLREGFLRQPGVRPMGSGRELYAVRKDGTEFPVEISLSPLVTEEGILVSAAVRDISERLALQREAERLRDELVATVSHELRTPLTSIIGYVELMVDLEGDALSESAHRMLGVIERNAQRELRLVNDLLDLASIDAAVVDVHHRVSLGTLARAVVEGQKITAGSRGVRLEVDVPEDIAVLGDPQRLAQVLDNLLANAVKFSEPGGSVVLAGGRDDQEAWLEVRDQGPGIPPADLPRVFDRLYRTADAVRAQVPGAGLGLTIAKAIVEAHGGRIAATSVVGQGTRMQVCLPPAP